MTRRILINLNLRHLLPLVGLFAATFLAPAASAQRLLDAPLLRYPVSEEWEFGRPFEWSQVAGANSYTLELCQDAACSILTTRVTDLRGAYWFPRQPLAGPLYWRVAATSIGGARGRFSPSVRVTPVARVGGKVLLDADASADPARMSGIAGARVLAWIDGGDRVADGADDSLVDETMTTASGDFSFRLLAPGLHWIVVDSRTVAPTASGGSVARVEQTYASAGGICGAPISVERNGACFGGRLPRRSDDPSALASSEHLIGAIAGDSGARELAFGFSHNVVIHTSDEASQGSIRQFLINAAALPGPNRMKFVPTEGKSGDRWTIEVASTLPVIADRDTVLDGTAHLSVVGTPRRLSVDDEIDLGSPLEVGRIRAPLTSPSRNDLEVSTTRREVETLLDIIAAGVEIRRLTLTTPASSIRLRDQSTAVLAELVIGTADRSGTIGIDVNDDATARIENSRIEGQSVAGVDVTGKPGSSARIEMSSTLLSRNRYGVVLGLEGSRVHRSFFLRNGLGTAGAGIRIGTEAAPASSTFIDSSTFSQNYDGIVIANETSAAVIQDSEFLSNGRAGIALSTTNIAWPTRVAFVRNDFDENEQAALVAGDKPARPAAGAGGCAAGSGINGGLPSADVRVAAYDDWTARVVGRACPGSTVDFYLTLESDTSRSNRRYAYGSKGEYRYVGSAEAAANGSFEAVVRDVTPEGSISAIVTDTAGNSSFLSDPRRVSEAPRSAPIRDAVRARNND